MRRANKGLFVVLLFAFLGLCPMFAAPAAATPAIVVDAASGDVLYQEDAARPWFPASLTKLMTAYVALTAVREHRISLDTPLVVSARAASMAPSKMGFKPGTEVTLDNALRMMLVKSANDLAVTIAEGVSGSVEAFADDMNTAAAQLGLQESHFTNPNGLPDPRHFSSARDLAMIARALYLTFPDKADLFGIGALSLGGEIITNHNPLLGRYPGVDGMKTGFTCSAGFNLVASAYRGGRRLIVVILGAPNVAERTMKAAVLLDRGFANIDHPAGSVTSIAYHGDGRVPDLRPIICRNRKKAIEQFSAEVQQLEAPLANASAGTTTQVMPERAFLFSPASIAQQPPMAARISMVPAPVFDPQPVFLGPAPGYTGAVAQARPPHSPVGTEPPPTASAYAATPSAAPATPLAPDANALSLHGRGRHLARRTATHAKVARHVVAKAKVASKPQRHVARTKAKAGSHVATKAKTAAHPAAAAKRAASASK